MECNEKEEMEEKEMIRDQYQDDYDDYDYFVARHRREECEFDARLGIEVTADNPQEVTNGTRD